MMPYHGTGDIETAPAGDAGAQTELRVVAEHEEVFVESADLVEHGFAVHGGGAIRPEALLDAVILAAIDLAGAAAAVLAIGGDEMANLVDAARIFVHQHLGGRHADIRRRAEGASQGRQEVRLRLGVVVQKSDEAAVRGGKRLVVGGAESAVHGVGNYVDAKVRASGEVRADHLERSIARAIIYHDDFEIGATLPSQRFEAGAQVVAPVPIDYGYGDVWRHWKKGNLAADERR